jgi:predicted RNase H-like HicB family nuclease
MIDYLRHGGYDYNILEEWLIQALAIRKWHMEKILRIRVERLPEGVYLATSDDLQGLVAQGRTVTETMEIARDVARKLLEARSDRDQSTPLESVADQFEYPLIVGCGN